MTTSHIVHRFIQDAGNLTQSLGLGRILGQIFAYLYFSPEPRAVTDICRRLGISKGSVSMTVRQLEQWGAVQRVWVKGDRKDYYEATDWLGRIIRNAMQDIVGKRIESYAGLIAEAEQQLNGKGSASHATDPESEFLRRRIAHLRVFQKKASSLWNNPLVQMLVK